MSWPPSHRAASSIPLLGPTLRMSLWRHSRVRMTGPVNTEWKRRGPLPFPAYVLLYRVLCPINGFIPLPLYTMKLNWRLLCQT
ncbi:unnamed protein product [Peniophora sp. CBMAI 1063]|nr:unnamed protein product [Peniophora sp. CBMAI 1063]